MKKRVIIVHGWGGTPNVGWYPWLKQELEQKGFDVKVPQMPNTYEPRIETWVPALSKVTGDIDENTYFVGHSIGCQTIIRLLDQQNQETRVGGIIYVGGFISSLSNEEDDPEDKEIARIWLDTPLSFEKVKQIGKSVAIFSDNDPDVPLENKDDFEQKLNSEIITEHNMFHFDESHGIIKLPIVLKKLLEMAN